MNLLARILQSFRLSVEYGVLQFGVAALRQNKSDLREILKFAQGYSSLSEVTMVHALDTKGAHGNRAYSLGMDREILSGWVTQALGAQRMVL